MAPATPLRLRYVFELVYDTSGDVRLRWVICGTVGKRLCGDARRIAPFRPDEVSHRGT